MPKSAYPATTDALNRLSLRGEIDPGFAAEVTDALASAIAEFERRTGHVPMLAQGADVTRRVNAPVSAEGILLLDRDLASLTSVSYLAQGSSGSPTVFVLGTDFQAEPFNAPADGKPYTSLVFYPRRWLAPLTYPYRDSLYITGKWGYALALPDDAWEAMVVGACARVYPGLRAAGRVGPNSVSRGGGEAAGGTLTESWGTPAADQVAAWKAQFEAAVWAFKSGRAAV